MVEIGVLKLVHLLGLTYWLGADLGVFYSSYFVTDDRLSDDTRLTMAKLLFALDQAPRIAMPIMLGSGVHLAWRLGALPLPGIAVAAAWLLVAVWLASVLLLHVRGPSAIGLARFDLALRVGAVAGLVAYSVWGLISSELIYWVAWKLIVFALLVGCGLIIRRRLKSFGPAYAALAGGTAGAAENAAMRDAMAGARPFVLAIWIGLILSAALGLHLI